MRRGIAHGLATAGMMTLLLSGSPVARATHCDQTVVIFSGRNLGTGNPRPWPNVNAGSCVADSEHVVPYDTRIINPGSDAISIQYRVDLGEQIEAVPAVVDGLGFMDEAITLTRSTSSADEIVYDSGIVMLPDPMATGCVTAAVILGEDPQQHPSTTFHTIDTPSCEP